MALAAAGLGSDGVDGAQNASISAAEKKLYDRQLRVWGLGAQQRLMQSCLYFSFFSCRYFSLTSFTPLFPESIYDPITVSISP